MKALSAIALAAFVSIPGVAIGASDPPPGASGCSDCHATNAEAETPVPKINGRRAAEIVTAMAAFRDGSKPSTVMGRVAKGFTDDEVKSIAAWLEQHK